MPSSVGHQKWHRAAPPRGRHSSGGPPGRENVGLDATRPSGTASVLAACRGSRAAPRAHSTTVALHRHLPQEPCQRPLRHAPLTPRLSCAACTRAASWRRRCSSCWMRACASTWWVTWWGLGQGGGGAGAGGGARPAVWRGCNGRPQPAALHLPRARTAPRGTGEALPRARARAGRGLRAHTARAGRPPPPLAARRARARRARGRRAVPLPVPRPARVPAGLCHRAAAGRVEVPEAAVYQGQQLQPGARRAAGRARLRPCVTSEAGRRAGREGPQAGCARARSCSACSSQQALPPATSPFGNPRPCPGPAPTALPALPLPPRPSPPQTSRRKLPATNFPPPPQEFSKEDMEFQERIVYRSGLGDETTCPPCEPGACAREGAGVGDGRTPAAPPRHLPRRGEATAPASMRRPARPPDLPG